MAIYVIGGGFAGVEAAWAISAKKVNVKLLEMKPRFKSPAHTSDKLCELVCSNSFKSKEVNSASGLLKEEMRRLGSLTLFAADRTSVPAGGALAVDRELFASMVTEAIHNSEYIEVVDKKVDALKEITDLEDCEGVIIATGPLTDNALAEDIARLLGESSLSFYDAAAPVVFAESVDMTKAFYAARYGKGTADYINCPMNREEYNAFYNALLTAERAPVHGFDSSCVYEGCMPVEVMAERGEDTLRFGPLKPVGIRNPETDESYYAVVQLRQDDAEGTLYNIVGFQTRLKFGEQKRVFGMIPALANAEYARYGVMHRNTYIHSPGVLDETYMLMNNPEGINVPVFFAGQITGVEGYIESASSGLIAGLNAWAKVTNHEPIIIPKCTQVGALAHYAAHYVGGNFQPMGANFGIMEVKHTKKDVRDKRELKNLYAQDALTALEELKQSRSDYFGTDIL